MISLKVLKRQTRSSYRDTKAQLKLSFTTLLAAYRRILQAEIPLIAGSLSFTTVLTLVPFLAVSLSVFHWLGGLEGLLKQIEPFILKNLVESSGVEFSRYLLNAIRRIHSGTLGVTGVVGLLLASTRLFIDMEKAIQRVWLLKKKRALWKRLIVYWGVMFVGPLVLAALLGVIGSKDLGLIRVLSNELIAAFFALLGLFFIYKWVPARPVEFRPAFASALLATVGLALAQEFYAGAMRGLFRFSKVYGSLAGIPLFLLWIFLLWWIILLGATLTAILQERRDAIAT
ncbi:hypothetical protein BH10BDE1_BH10BDE1_19630 [soil metagenome]